MSGSRRHTARTMEQHFWDSLNLSPHGHKMAAIVLSITYCTHLAVSQTRTRWWQKGGSSSLTPSLYQGEKHISRTSLADFPSQFVAQTWVSCLSPGKSLAKWDRVWQRLKLAQLIPWVYCCSSSAWIKSFSIFKNESGVGGRGILHAGNSVCHNYCPHFIEVESKSSENTTNLGNSGAEIQTHFFLTPQVFPLPHSTYGFTITQNWWGRKDWFCDFLQWQTFRYGLSLGTQDVSRWGHQLDTCGPVCHLTRNFF